MENVYLFYVYQTSSPFQQFVVIIMNNFNYFKVKGELNSFWVYKFLCETTLLSVWNERPHINHVKGTSL